MFEQKPLRPQLPRHAPGLQPRFLRPLHGALLCAVLTACARSRVTPLAVAATCVSPCEPSPAAATSPPNTLTVTEHAAGWTLLFDGRTLHGWRVLGFAGIPTAHWMVADGAIKKVASGKIPVQADGQPLEGGDLLSEGRYRDFELSWEWKVVPGANSGVKYNVSEALSTTVAPTHAAKGFEYQMLDDDRHEDGKLPTHRASALYDLVAANDRKQLRPVGEWNVSRIVLLGNHGEHWLNGEKVVDYDLGTAHMDSALVASKYRSMAWFADRRRGHIALQDHGDEVYFRSMKIRELSAAGR